MPRLAHRGHSTAQLDDAALAALLHGAPLGLPCRQGSMFYSRSHDHQELAMLRGLWRAHRESIVAKFQAIYPGLLPWAFWRFEATEPRDEQLYQAAYERHVQEITERMQADRGARLAAGQPWKERFADFRALANAPSEQRDQLRKEQYALLGINPETIASTSPA